jgi:glutamate synthase (NADPH/NADH) small chain
VEIDIPGFIEKIRELDFAAAARILKDKNSLPAICGRVCPQEDQCEKVCLLGKNDEPVAIGRLERFVADWEAGHPELMKKEPKEEPEPPASVRKILGSVAVVGSGPAGLTVAGDLARMGYRVVIFEAFH